MPPPHTATAASTYAERATRIRDHLFRIAKQLADHEAEQRQHPTDWGCAGDLGHVEARLAEIWEES